MFDLLNLIYNLLLVRFYNRLFQKSHRSSTSFHTSTNEMKVTFQGHKINHLYVG